MALTRTVRRVSKPNMPLEETEVESSDAWTAAAAEEATPETSSPIAPPDAAAVLLSLLFFAFLEEAAAEGVVVRDAPSGRSVVVVCFGDSLGCATSGSLESRYVSRREDKAIAEATQTTGVRVSIRRTMTPAK